MLRQTLLQLLTTMLLLSEPLHAGDYDSFEVGLAELRYLVAKSLCHDPFQRRYSLFEKAKRTNQWDKYSMLFMRQSLEAGASTELILDQMRYFERMILAEGKPYSDKDCFAWQYTNLKEHHWVWGDNLPAVYALQFGSMSSEAQLRVLSRDNELCKKAEADWSWKCPLK